MASAYPGGLDSFPTNRADGTVMATNHPGDHNNLADAVNKIEATLGVDPQGSFATVVARLDGGSQPLKTRIFTVAAADVADGPTLLYTPGAGEYVYQAVIADYVANNGVGIAVGPLGLDGNGNSRILALMGNGGSEPPRDTAIFVGGLLSNDLFAWPVGNDPIYASINGDPSNDAALAETWQAATLYGTSLAAQSIVEAGTWWSNTNSEGTSGGSKPDFAGNIGGSVADGPDIIWSDQGFLDYPMSTVGSMTVILLIAVPT